MNESNIGKNIKAYRVNKGLDQQGLGDLLYVTKSTISSWETGRFIPSIEKINKIAAALDISPSLLFKEPVVKNPEPRILPIGEALRTARKLSGYKQKEVANKMGVTQSTITPWENEKVSPSVKRIKELCLLYNVSACEILGLVCFQGDSRLFNIIKSYDTLVNEGKTKVFDYTMDIADKYQK